MMFIKRVQCRESAKIQRLIRPELHASQPPFLTLAILEGLHLLPFNAVRKTGACGPARRLSIFLDWHKRCSTMEVPINSFGMAYRTNWTDTLHLQELYAHMVRLVRRDFLLVVIVKYDESEGSLPLLSEAGPVGPVFIFGRRCWTREHQNAPGTTDAS